MAIGAGVAELGLQKRPTDLARLQAVAAVGQRRLMDVWAEAFEPFWDPRLNVYELAQFANAASGGSTSRVGADLAVPITQTASFIATFHPDYSNVELDQQ